LTGEVLFGGYLIHYLPYFFVERTLFLHHYLPAFVFKVLLTAAVIEHIALLSQLVSPTSPLNTTI
jgi:dolichyl-phosphate-mannose-protein mannosyltransferase